MDFSVAKYFGGTLGAFSLSFDDGCYKDSTLEVAEILREMNKKYSVNMKFTSAQTVNFLHEGLIDMWKELRKEGLCDIASHGIDHMVGFNEETPYERRYEDAKKSKEELEKIYGEKIFTYVGCGGGHTVEGSRVLDEFYYGHRAVEGDINYPYSDGFYMNFVTSFIGRLSFTDISPIVEVVNELKKNYGWVVQVNHWITHKDEDKFHAQRADVFKDECEYLAKNADTVWVCSFNDAVKYISEVKNGSLEVTPLDDGYELIFNCPLDKEIFDHPITIEAKTDKAVSVICEGEPVSVSYKDGVARFNALPNTKIIVK